jgi:hypothetical protein
VCYEPIHRGRDEIDRVAGAIKATHFDFRYQPIAMPEELGNGERIILRGRPDRCRLSIFRQATVLWTLPFASKSTHIAKYSWVRLSESQSYCWPRSAPASPNFFWISSWILGSKSVISNIRRTSTISWSEPGMREAHSSASSRDFT